MNHNGATNLTGDYVEIRRHYPHLTGEVIDALNEAVLAGLPPGDHGMDEIGPAVVDAYAWAEETFIRSDALRQVIDGQAGMRREGDAVRIFKRG